MNKQLTIIGVLVLVLIGGGLVWYLKDPTKKPRKPLSLDEVVEVLRQKTMALSYLEDADFELARPILNSLIKKLPDELFGYRNLAIGGLQQIAALGRDAESKKGTKKSRAEAKKKRAEAINWVRQAIDQLAEFDQESAESFILAARFIDAASPGDGRKQEQLDLLKKAATLDSGNPAVWYELFTVMGQSMPGDAVNQDRRSAIQKARELAPDNLRLEIEWLVELINHDGKAVAKSIPKLRRMAATVDALSDDIIQQLDNASLAEKNSDWEKVFLLMSGVANLLNGQEIAKSDRTRVKLNDLEFLVFDFSSQFYAKNPQPKKKVEPAIPVVIKPIDIKFPTKGAIQWIDTNDFNLDGREDLLVLRDGQFEVYSWREKRQWKQVVSVSVPGNWTGFAVADLNLTDNPGNEVTGKVPTDKIGVTSGCDPKDAAFLDVVLFGPSGLQVLEHDYLKKEARHVLVPIKQTHASTRDLKDVIAICLVDFDHDGLLDIVSTRTGQRGMALWLTVGSFQYRDVTKSSQLPSPKKPFTRLVAVDLDRDLDIDVIAFGVGCEPVLLENQRLGRFLSVPLKDRFADLAGADSVAVVDSDGNASWDLIGSGKSGTWLVLTTNMIPGQLKLLKSKKVATQSLTDFIVVDYDNDGYQDLIGRSFGKTWSVLRGTDGDFAKVDSVFNGDASQCPLYLAVDWDQDGDLDIVSNDKRTPSLFSNEGGNKNAWISLRTIGQHDNKGRANHDALGSLLELRAGIRYQSRVVSHPITHFGLGKTKQAEAIRILWTNGVPQVAILPENNQSICELMELKGSCPYLYTWDGTKWRFHTDLLWAAPIGLQTAEGKLAPSRPWEYLLIEGEHLKAKDGFYELRVTEELWEAAYFDQIRLLAVDHDQDIEVYSNEKVGPPTISKFHIHTVRKRHYPVSAKDKYGRDVSKLVNKRDEKYYRGFDRRIRQGLTDKHFLELNLGKLPANAKKITLFLTGWFYPTDTSLNVAISRDKSLPQIQFPSIWVPNEKGKWQKTVPYMGFPGGKTKTIAVDLSNVFLTSDHRLRIECNNELFWDEVFFTVDQQPAKLKVTPTELVSADLRYRGFSRLNRPDPNAPERFYYDDLSKNPKWPPMRGNFTRYGDVTPLLQKQDAKLLVMASGDEVVIRFRIPKEKVKPAQKRDFILHCVGWDKDADLNTIAGQRVEPLPFVGMKSYPYDMHQGAPDSPGYRRYLRTYQTRQQYAPRFLKWVKNYRAQ